MIYVDKQNKEAVVKKMDEIYKSRAFGYAEVENAIWFSNVYFNGLEKINKTTGKIEILMKFPNYDIWRQCQHSYVVCVGQKLIFVPFRSRYIISYDIKTNEFMSVALKLSKTGKTDLYYFGACVCEQYVYMFPVKARCIIRYDVRKNVIKYLDDLSVIVENISENSIRFMLQYEIVDGKVFLPFTGLNAMAVFNLCDEKIEIQPLDIDGGCSAVCHCKSVFFSKTRKIHSFETVSWQDYYYNRQVISNYLVNNSYYERKKKGGLKEYINLIRYFNFCLNCYDVTNYGKKIYDMVRKI